jgi:hypothetical protein
VISSRAGAAVALVLALVAVALSIVAFMSTVRDETVKPGRLVQTRVNSDYAGDPIFFPVDHFYIGYDSGLQFRAFYAYAPGFYGHMRGCQVVWDGNAIIDTPQGREGPGLYVDPCGGARFSRDGELIAGPADRGLDRFGTEPGVEGVIVDTRKLFCGQPLPTPEPTATAGSATPTATAAPPTAVVTASATAQTFGTATPTASPTETATPSATATEDATPEATATPAICERVTSDSKQP